MVSLFFLDNKFGQIYSSDNDTIDVMYDGKRHSSKITLSGSNILVHMPFEMYYYS